MPFKSFEAAWLKILIGIFLVSTVFQYRLGERKKSFPMKLAFFAPLVWLGFPPQAVVGLLAAGLFYQFWIHADWLPSFGPLEWVLNTPRHHRVHHASNASCLDKNFGGVFIIWDRLFGTFAEAPKDEKLRFGLVSPLPSQNLLTVNFHEWRKLVRDTWRARGLKARLRVLVGAP